MRSPYLRCFLCAAACYLIAAIRADEIPAHEPPAELLAELAEIRATGILVESHSKVREEGEPANEVLSSLRNLIDRRIQRGCGELMLESRSQHPSSGKVARLPSILATEAERAGLDEGLSTAWKTRRSAYVGLIERARGIDELRIKADCLLNLTGALGDAEAYESLTDTFAGNIRGGARIETYISLGGHPDRSLEPAVFLVQLATKLDRLDEIPALTAGIPESNHQANALARRFEALAGIYAATSDDEFVAAVGEALQGNLIRSPDIKTAIDFAKRPISCLARIYLLQIDGEELANPSPQDMVQLLRELPSEEDDLAHRLVSAHLGLKSRFDPVRGQFAATILGDEKLATRFERHLPDLMEVTLKPRGAGRLSPDLLSPVTEFLATRLKGDDRANWLQAANDLLTWLTRAPEPGAISEGLADRLLEIAADLDDEDLLTRTAEKVAPRVTWPFYRVYRLLAAGKTKAAHAMMDHGIRKNLFSMSSEEMDPAAIVDLAETSLGWKVDERNTFITILLAKSVPRISRDEALRSRALSVLETAAKRWGDVEHSEDGFLQQGNRVLWRDPEGDLRPSVPALRLWMQRNPVEESFTLDGPLKSLGDDVREVYRRCLNSGHFPEAVAHLADLLTRAGIEGNEVAHRSLTDRMSECISSNRSGKSTPRPLSTWYGHVRTWLLIHGDPSLQKQPADWAGIRMELAGLELSEEEVAQVIRDILSNFSDTNHNRRMTLLRSLDLCLKLPSEPGTALESRLLDFPGFFRWSPASTGSPKEVFDMLDEALRDQPFREVWASMMLSAAIPASHSKPGSDTAERGHGATTAPWPAQFSKAAEGTWLERLARVFEQAADQAWKLEVASLSSPRVLENFGEMPLWLRRRIATSSSLRTWLAEHPEILPKAMPLCIDAIAESVVRVPKDASPHEARTICSLGQVSQIIVSKAGMESELVQFAHGRLTEAVTQVESRSGEGTLPPLEAALAPIREFLFRLEERSNRLESSQQDKVAPEILLQSLIAKEQVGKAVALLCEPEKEFGFKRLDPSPTGFLPGQEVADRRRQVVDKVVAAVPDAFADRRLYLRVLFAGDMADLHRPLAMRWGVPDEPGNMDPRLVTLLSDFDRHEFSDSALMEKCLARLVGIDRAGRFLSRKLKLWHEHRKTRPAGGNFLRGPALAAWCDLMIFSGNRQETEKLIESVVAARRSRDPLFLRRIDDSLQLALQDGLVSGQPEREQRCREIAGEILKAKMESARWSGYEAGRLSIRGILLGYLLVKHPEDAETKRLEEELLNGGRRNPRPIPETLKGPLDLALETMERMNPDLVAASRNRLLSKLRGLQERCPPENGSLTFISRCVAAGLLSLESALVEVGAAAENHPEDLRNQLDLASLYFQAGRDAQALEILRSLSKKPSAKDDTVASRVRNGAIWLLLPEIGPPAER